MPFWFGKINIAFMSTSRFRWHFYDFVSFQADDTRALSKHFSHQKKKLLKDKQTDEWTFLKRNDLIFIINSLLLKFFEHVWQSLKCRFAKNCKQKGTEKFQSIFGHSIERRRVKVFMNLCQKIAVMNEAVKHDDSSALRS